MTAWANILFLLFVVFLGMFMTHLAIRHEQIRADGTKNSPFNDDFRAEGFRNNVCIGGVGGHAGGGLGGLHIRKNMCGSYIEYAGSGIQAPALRFEDWHKPIKQPHYYPGGGATISRHWKGTGRGNGWVGYGWPFIWWGPTWYPEHAYICNKDSDCGEGKCGISGLCIV